MKLLILAVLLLLAGCASPPAVDYSKVEQQCAAKCQANDVACTSRFTGFPIMMQMQCNAAVEACVNACPKVGGDTQGAPVGNRLKELDALRRDGLISEAEYQQKRQEILKAM